MEGRVADNTASNTSLLYKYIGVATSKVSIMDPMVNNTGYCDLEANFMALCVHSRRT